MTDYISREAAKEKCCSLCRWEGTSNCDECEHPIDDIPAVDVRPVVLCRDCDNWNDWDSAGKESLGNYVCSCAYWTVEDGAVFYTRPTDFCSYGEKREDS